MSQWTHVNASFRLNSRDKISDEEIEEIFGKCLDFNDMIGMDYYEIGTDEWLEPFDKNKYLPCGSEGSLQINTWHNPEKGELASTTVNVFGDLRDGASFDEMKEWFDKCCSSFWIRQAICEVKIGRVVKVFRRNFDFDEIIEFKEE